MANYIDNQQFLAAIVERKAIVKECKKEKKPKPPLSNYIGQCLILIAQNLSHLPKFTNYPHKEDMIGDAIENSIRYFDNYNLKYKNPHAYFTKIVYYAFLRRIQKEKDQLYGRYKLHQQIGVLGAVDGVSDESLSSQFQVYENIAEFIETYEKKAAEKKIKLAEKRPKSKKAKKGKKKARKPRKGKTQ